MVTPADDDTCFLNVDLDIEAPYDLAPLVKALGRRIYDLHTGALGDGFQTHLEFHGARGQPSTAAMAIEGFVGLLAKLRPKAKQLWNKATRRDFNIGIQSGARPFTFELDIPSDLLSAVARLRGRIVVTVYSAQPKHSQRRRRRPTSR
jgi:hypothetical protein